MGVTRRRQIATRTGRISIPSAPDNTFRSDDRSLCPAAAAAAVAAGSPARIPQFRMHLALPNIGTRTDAHRPSTARLPYRAARRCGGARRKSSPAKRRWSHLKPPSGPDGALAARRSGLSRDWRRGGGQWSSLARRDLLPRATSGPVGRFTSETLCSVGSRRPLRGRGSRWTLAPPRHPTRAEKAKLSKTLRGRAPRRERPGRGALDFRSPGPPASPALSLSLSLSLPPPPSPFPGQSLSLARSLRFLLSAWQRCPATSFLHFRAAAPSLPPARNARTARARGRGRGVEKSPFSRLRGQKRVARSCQNYVTAVFECCLTPTSRSGE